MRRSLPGVTLIALAILVPASADADTRFVASGGVDAPGCTDAGAPCATLPYAVGQSTSGDRIQIGPGNFVGSVETIKTLTFVGAGSGSLDGMPGMTVIRGTPGSGGPASPALELETGGAVRSLQIEAGDGAANLLAPAGHGGGTGVLFSPTSPGAHSLELEDVVIEGGDGGPGEVVSGPAGNGIRVAAGPGSVAFSAHGSEFAGGSGFGQGLGVEVDGPSATAELVDSRVLNPEHAGVVLFGGAEATLESVEIETPNTGLTVYEGAATIRRSRIQTNSLALGIEATNEVPASAELLDSLLFSTQSSAAFVYSEGAQSSAGLIATGSTLVGFGPSSAITVVREEIAGPATATLRNSIARNTPALPPGKPFADLRAFRGTIDADFSSFTTALAADGGSISAPGSAGNIAGDPLFVNPAEGDFALQGSSPVIDRGNPALVGAGELDLAGSPRSLDGNRDCVAAPDVGAFEVTGQSAACPDPIPTISKFGMTNKVFAPKGGKSKKGQASKAVKRGTKFTYLLSEAAKVKITIERKKAGKGKKGKPKFSKVTTLSGQKEAGKQSTKFSGRVKGKPLKPGKYRATIVATDAAGQESEPDQLTFHIVTG
jgi:hypothetical protein